MNRTDLFELEDIADQILMEDALKDYVLDEQILVEWGMFPKQNSYAINAFISRLYNQQFLNTPLPKELKYRDKVGYHYATDLKSREVARVKIAKYKTKKALKTLLMNLSQGPSAAHTFFGDLTDLTPSAAHAYTMQMLERFEEPENKDRYRFHPSHFADPQLYKKYKHVYIKGLDDQLK